MNSKYKVVVDQLSNTLTISMLEPGDISCERFGSFMSKGEFGKAKYVGVFLNNEGGLDIKYDLPNMKDIKEDYIKEVSTTVIGRVNKFQQLSIKEKLSTSEFIPLSGYPKEKLQEEILDCIEKRRNLVLIGSFKEYKDLMLNFYEFTGQEVLYGTEDFIDFAILIREGKMKEVKEKYNPEKIKW